jgi:hypothetical protein
MRTVRRSVRQPPCRAGAGVDQRSARVGACQTSELNRRQRAAGAGTNDRYVKCVTHASFAATFPDARD